jgi:hypothetical protein
MWRFEDSSMVLDHEKQYLELETFKCIFGFISTIDFWGEIATLLKILTYNFLILMKIKYCFV